MADSESQGLEGESGEVMDKAIVSPQNGFWDSYYTIPCADGKERRCGAGICVLAHGIPKNIQRVISELQKLGYSAADSRRIIKEARNNRVIRLQGYGNAIVPQVAVEFIKSFMEILDEEVA
jgi:hypothetical protein